MKRYKGRTDDGRCEVVVEEDGRHAPLNPRFDIRNHSPDGFNWGYQGSGPTQLALAILCDATGDDVMSQNLYHDFKREVIAKLPMDSGWEMTAEEVVDRVLEIQAFREVEKP